MQYLASWGPSVTHSKETSVIALSKLNSPSTMAKMPKVCKTVPDRIQQTEKKYCIVFITFK